MNYRLYATMLNEWLIKWFWLKFKQSRWRTVNQTFCGLCEGRKWNLFRHRNTVRQLAIIFTIDCDVDEWPLVQHHPTHTNTRQTKQISLLVNIDFTSFTLFDLGNKSLIFFSTKNKHAYSLHLHKFDPKNYLASTPGSTAHNHQHLINCFLKDCS